MLLNDTHRRTVKIPIRTTLSGIEFVLPVELQARFRSGYTGDLTIPERAVADPELLDWLHEQSLMLFLPAESVVYAAIRPGNPRPSAGHLQYLNAEQGSLPWPLPDSYPAKIILKEDLKLNLRGTKAARLQPCKVHIPFLKEDAGSINQAYTRLSTAFEPHRKSHTGNVFNLLYFIREGRLISFGDHRDAVEVDSTAPEDGDLFSTQADDYDS